MPALPDQLQSSRGTPATGTGENRSRALNSSVSDTAATPVHPLLRVAGGLSLAGVLLGIILLLLTCAGLDAALDFSPAVLALGVAGGILTLLSTRHSPATETGPILASLFMSALALLGGVLQLAVWLQWPILFGQHVSHP
jgi:hypothetical protein